MSYLDTPRFSFLGGFHADVPTRNNDLGNYAPDNSIPIVTPGDWNSNGAGGFGFRRCRVTSAMTRDGRLIDSAAGDRLIGAAISSRPHGGNTLPREFGDAKIVDLDPFQRRLSTIFGLEITIEINTPDDQLIVNGKMEPTCFRDYWNRRALGGMLMPASTTFQSILTDVSWNGSLDLSPVLEQLANASEQTLSIKFNVDRFALSNDPEQNLSGRLIGTIGPYVEGEPHQFVAQRRLVWTAAAKTSQFWAAPWQVDRRRQKLVFDLGNSVQVASTGGPAVNQQVHAAILPTEGSSKLAKSVVLTPPLNTSNQQLELTAGIVEADLDDRQSLLLDEQRIGLLLSPNDVQPVLAEHPSGKYIDVEEWVYRLDPGESATIRVRALWLGQPLANEQVPFYCVTQAGYDINLPLSVLFHDGVRNPAIAVTGSDGRATLKLTAQPGTINGLPASRKYVDSQIYMLGDTAGWQAWGMVGPPVTPASENNEIAPPNQRLGIVTILVFNTHDEIAAPTWDEHVGPIFERYAKLYPAMKDRIALDLREVVLQNATTIAASLQLSRDDPQHMPVTRDLSAYDRDMILRWLEQEAK